VKFGLTPSQYDFILETVDRPLSAQGATVWCYGSRARGDFTKFSDLDLMVETDQDLSREVAAIREKLESGNFPYKVDIVLLQELAPAYRAGYEKDKVAFED